jgi:deoxyribonuclease-4
MPQLGAHMSIAGGYYRAVEAAAAVQCDCVQLFTKNNNQWKGKPITDDDAKQFQDALIEHHISAPLSHSSYLINLASPDSILRNQSIDAMVVELQRADKLGIPFVVLHPGSFTTSTEQQGLVTVARSLDEVFRQTGSLLTRCLLENTAGQGSNLGWRFEHLTEIMASCNFPDRLGICIDTCHTFAAGYPLTKPAEYDQTIRELDQAVGLKSVKAIHLNDSKMPLGSRKDRHEHIGRGELGLSAFRNVLNDPRMEAIPMYLETEKGTENGEDLDAMNLRTLRSLIGKQPRKGKGGRRTARK